MSSALHQNEVEWIFQELLMNNVNEYDYLDRNDRIFDCITNWTEK